MLIFSSQVYFSIEGVDYIFCFVGEECEILFECIEHEL